MSPDSEFAVGWGTLALINANIGQLKRRRWAWFGLSLLLGPIATALLLIVPVER